MHHASDKGYRMDTPKYCDNNKSKRKNEFSNLNKSQNDNDFSQNYKKMNRKRDSPMKQYK